MGRAQSQMIRALESLAMVDVYAVAPIERVLQDESRRIPQGSSVALVTAIVTPALVVTLADLRRRGLSMSVVWAGTDDPPRLPQGVALHDMRSVLAGRRFYRPFVQGLALDAPELFDRPLSDRPLDEGAPVTAERRESLTRGAPGGGPVAGRLGARPSAAAPASRGATPSSPWQRPAEPP